MDTEYISKTLQVFTIILTVIGVLFTIIAAVRSGILNKIRFRTSENSPKHQEDTQALIKTIIEPGKESLTFETEQLAQYYAQVLAQSKTSFWFSLIFASLGFLVIILAGFKYTTENSGSTIVQLTSGIIMDAVAALFFVQSKSAQISMGQFFDKLRKDRQQVESRKLCESITDPLAKDALKIQLALRYAEIENSDEISNSIIQTCLKLRSSENPL